MSAALSRRALLRGLVHRQEVISPRTATSAQVEGQQVEGHERVANVAWISAVCVEPQGVTCRRCGDVCDENAIRFTPLPGGRAMARVDPVKCSGCSECLNPCPVGAISLMARSTLASTPSDTPETRA